MNQGPIFLLGTHKSGTSLLRSILDSHSQLFVIPIETHYFQLIDRWVDYEYRSARPKEENHKEIIGNFIQYIHHRTTSPTHYGDSDVRGLFDEERFRKSISKIREDDGDKQRIEKYFEAIYFSLRNEHLPSDIRVVEKSIENAEFAVELQALFPQAKFVHIVRNPYANIVSIRKSKSGKHGFPLMPRIIKSLYNGYYYLYKNQKIIPNYLVIRYKDLVSDPEVHIRKLCQYLEIPFEKILLTPTVQGKLWRGNSSTNQSFISIESSRLNSWQKNILPLEVYYINKLFPFVVQDFGYQKFNKGGSIWKKARGENLRRYFYNRFYYLYMR